MFFSRCTARAWRSRSQVLGKSIIPLPDTFLPSIAHPLLPILIAICLYAKKDEDSDNALECVPAFHVKETTKKGYGAFASRNLARGEIVISEMPLFCWPTKLEAAEAHSLLEELRPRAKEAFFSLANNQSSNSTLDEILAIRATNGFNVQLPPIPAEVTSTKAQENYALNRQPSHASFLYPRIARINHSCLPNADHSIDWATLQMTVYATRPIQEGEEINIEYQSAMVQRTAKQRSEQLMQNFNFSCQCTLCSDANRVKNSDKRRLEIGSLVDQVAKAGETRDRPRIAQGLENIRLLLQQEGYQAMPEFSNDNVSNAYAMYATMKRQELEQEA